MQMIEKNSCEVFVFENPLLLQRFGFVCFANEPDDAALWGLSPAFSLQVPTPELLLSRASEFEPREKKKTQGF